MPDYRKLITNLLREGRFAEAENVLLAVMAAFPLRCPTGNEKYCPPWTGNFDEIENPLEMIGLGRLNSILERQQTRERTATPEAKTAFALAELFRTLRFQQAIRREIDTQGLARVVPVLVGSNETGPFLETVHCAG